MDRFLTIDSTKGGNGDIWMRLVGFYAVSDLLPDYKLRICIPSYFGTLADFAFGDKLIIVTDNSCKPDLTYTNLGIRHLFQDLIKGKRFISPYQRSVIHDKKKKALKDYINTWIFNVADVLGLVQIPAAQWISCYQGYLDIIGIKKLRHISYGDFKIQVEKFHPRLLEKFSTPVHASSSLNIPHDLHEHIVFFPNGTSRQFVPLWWAQKHMPEAYYAFFANDAYADTFEKAGLKVIRFHKPMDIIRLAQGARWAISTDSFPSHLLQTASKKCTILLTEALRARIVSPAFKGKVVDADAICHPCLHLARDLHPLCAAGHSECINWQKSTYTANILRSVHALADHS
ncbi:hypothetical protein [Dyadobacter sp. CY351]|uniref:hypothetical protein n=1 Tax=Dyadobacter sp. CY351 TaxID=2909337 RepID=UPI001F2376B4|nr:hypothetical protein [Dyadobacter sp. CY351]MCF2519158.1 hypothetical protein [Dyadobacter sp. CY351]